MRRGVATDRDLGNDAEMRSLLLVLLFAAACGGAKKSATPPGSGAPPTTEAEQKSSDAPADEAMPDGDKAKADPCEGGEAK